MASSSHNGNGGPPNLPTHRGRNIPWLAVVQFHKEIAARAENRFFSIHAKDANAERWTSIDSFDLNSLGGPWEVEASQLTSNAFRMSVEQGAHDSVFLGGPCYLGWEKSFKGGFVPQWRPILYREVGAIINGGVVEVEVVPEHGCWSLGPLITSAIDRLQVSVGDDPDKLVTQILEKAATARAQGCQVFRAPGRAVMETPRTVMHEIRQCLEL